LLGSVTVDLEGAGPDGVLLPVRIGLWDDPRGKVGEEFGVRGF
jgi:hypothetical protein